MSREQWLILLALAVPIGMLIGAVPQPRIRMRLTVIVIICAVGVLLSFG
jgi:hypothetical protein